MSSTKVNIYPTMWTIPEVLRQPTCLFIFEDSDSKFGFENQAVIRDRFNSFGIPTRKYPGRSSSDYYNDTEFEDNKKKIDKAIEHVIQLSTSFETVYLPRDGFGNGYADLERRAPKTYFYLQEAVTVMKNKIEIKIY